ncbi:hypothetical protein CAPTEDRAFT_184514 [Capitella teleta]|uniref:medium-chain acyl-CoA ligase n=1 Tax=Capitella teleta TaxID=283909 RepID=R7U7F4_CAPTE|nr:hypothetical protein CAPTEDRAFT_184514 [Capitella teleta]|eukprot:ELU02061.1 hypothetical protein CAPTEDRAFT_184514 [Capitella teleta]
MAALRILLPRILSRPALWRHGNERFLSKTPCLSRDLNSVEPSAAGFNDYEAERRNFNMFVPEYYNFAKDVIDVWAAKEKSGVRDATPAFWWIGEKPGEEVKWSFADLSEKSKRVAHLLSSACGLKRKDKVIVILPRVPAWWLVNIACIRNGTILIPGTCQLTARDIKHRILRSTAECLIVDDATADKVDQILPECPHVKAKILVGKASPGRKHDGWLMFDELYESANSEYTDVLTKSKDTMTIFFTSGTTGEPKMTEHSHASYGLAHHITGKYWLDLCQKDIHWSMSDTGWAKCAWSNLFAPWLRGACVFVHRLYKFDPLQVLQTLDDYPITTFCGPPTAYRMMVLEDMSKYKMASLRHCVSAGEPLNPDVMEQFFDGTGQIIREGYGQTESVLQCGIYRCIPNKPGSMGKPPPGIDLRIVNENYQEVKPGEEGLIGIKVKPHRPLGLFSRYLNEPVRTLSAFKGDYYITGDRAVQDEEGYFWFVGRADDIIISAGYRIGPFEVESALIEHPAVAESAVVSSPDAERGEVVKAFIVRTNEFKDVNEEELINDLQTFVKEITAPYKYPRKIEFVDSLPKTPSEKIRRVDLREREWKK